MTTISVVRYFAFVHILLVAGAALALSLAVIVVSMLGRYSETYRHWFAGGGFIVGTLWLVTFIAAMVYGVKASGGVGFQLNIFALVLLIGFESGLLGIFAFHSLARALALIPVGACIYTVYPWISAYVQRIWG